MGAYFKLSQHSFDFVNRNKEAWFHTGMDLLHSADILLERTFKAAKIVKTIKSGNIEPGTKEYNALADWTSFNHASLLIALAIENFLKGVWVVQNDIQTSDNISKLPSELKTHNLVDLSKKIGLVLNKKEMNALYILEDFILWRGRYPIPLNVQKLANSYEMRPALILENAENNDLPIEIHSIIYKIFQTLKK